MNRCVTDVPVQREAHFFIVNLAERRFDLLVRHINELRAASYFYVRHLDAIRYTDVLSTA
ncbi:MAG: hypothetical protein K8R50_12220 [Betaproteobacteria bacterium]|nr:hypothetical protein [Betaproteobacteria bacterium]MCX7196016.1 hypothetical protein [Pseudomonadota bacterium]